MATGGVSLAAENNDRKRVRNTYENSVPSGNQKTTDSTGLEHNPRVQQTEYDITQTGTNHTPSGLPSPPSVARAGCVYFVLASTKYASIPSPNNFDAIPIIGKSTDWNSHIIDKSLGERANIFPPHKIFPSIY
jgi:hypothetical protein